MKVVRELLGFLSIFSYFVGCGSILTLVLLQIVEDRDKIVNEGILLLWVLIMIVGAYNITLKMYYRD